MFDDVTAPENQGGLRGLLARHFGPVTHPDVARDEAHDVSLVFFVVAAIVAVLTLVRSGVLNAPVPIAIAVLAGLLRVSMSRVAASILLVLTAVNAALAFPGLGALILLGFAARATQLTFAYHRLVKAAAVSPTNPPESPVASSSPPSNRSGA